MPPFRYSARPSSSSPPMPPGIVEPPFHQFRTPEPDAHRLSHGILFIEAFLVDEVWEDRSADPVTAGAVYKHLPSARLVEHVEDSIERLVAQAAFVDGNVGVLEPERR